MQRVANIYGLSFVFLIIEKDRAWYFNLFIIFLHDSKFMTTKEKENQNQAKSVANIYVGECFQQFKCLRRLKTLFSTNFALVLHLALEAFYYQITGDTKKNISKDFYSQ